MYKYKCAVRSSSIYNVLSLICFNSTTEYILTQTHLINRIDYAMVTPELSLLIPHLSTSRTCSVFQLSEHYSSSCTAVLRSIISSHPPINGGLLTLLVCQIINYRYKAIVLVCVSTCCQSGPVCKLTFSVNCLKETRSYFCLCAFAPAACHHKSYQMPFQWTENLSGQRLWQSWF